MIRFTGAWFCNCAPAVSVWLSILITHGQGLNITLLQIVIKIVKNVLKSFGLMARAAADPE